ncbi:hypothetical protein BGZ82_009130, partial [Podila clonocystis]
DITLHNTNSCNICTTNNCSNNSWMDLAHDLAMGTAQVWTSHPSSRIRHLGHLPLVRPSGPTLLHIPDSTVLVQSWIVKPMRYLATPAN